jgi:hypothetical protein
LPRVLRLPFEKLGRCLDGCLTFEQLPVDNSPCDALTIIHAEGVDISHSSVRRNGAVTLANFERKFAESLIDFIETFSRDLADFSPMQQCREAEALRE